MTYRLVPPRVWSQLQKVTLVVTIFIGVSIALAPPDRDSRITAIEQAMNVDIWAFTMIGAAIVALVLEFVMERRKTETWVNMVGYMHIVLCSLMVGYGASAFAGVLTRSWWNFGAPAVAILLAYLHMIYVRRRPRAHR